MTEYSSKELELIESLSPHWYKIITSKNSINPPTLYQILALQMFSENRCGKDVDSLRRVITAISDCTTYRITPEFDNMIQL